MINIDFGTNLNTKVVLCLGYFGCVHKGHMQLINLAKSLASANQSKVALLTFDDGVISALNGRKSALFTHAERLTVYDFCGVDYTISAHFDDAFCKTSGAEFVRQLMRYNLSAVVCGTDYTFGCDMLGVDELKRQLDVPVYVVETLNDSGEKISTERLVKYVIDNQIERANALLQVPYFVSGNVVHGRQVGTNLGFPTANIDVPDCKVLPHGVFAGHTTVDGKNYRCVVNIGKKPTFDIDSVTVEVHLIGFDGNLYGKFVTVYLDKFLRETKRFSTVDELQSQLKSDVMGASND